MFSSACQKHHLTCTTISPACRELQTSKLLEKLSNKISKLAANPAPPLNLRQALAAHHLLHPVPLQLHNSAIQKHHQPLHQVIKDGFIIVYP
jgi:hypothetical protein